MFKYLVASSLFFLSGLAAGGGSSGGTGTLTAKEYAEVLRSQQPDLGLEKLPISIEDFRRARARLAAGQEAAVYVKGQRIL